MSSGGGCTVKAHRKNWVVTVRNANYSAFNGYHRTPSDYSEVHCIDPEHTSEQPPMGSSIWRTKAAYVDDLPDAP